MRLHLRVGMSVVVWVALLGLGSGCAVSDRQVISQAADAHSELRGAVMNDPQLSSYIQAVGQRIIQAAREAHQQGVVHAKAQSQEDTSWMFSNQMQFHFVASDTVNAFTTGGNHMYIYSELFEQVQTEGELAAVMAHEFAHVYARHVQRGMQRQQYTLLGAAAAGAAGYAMSDEDNRLANAATFAGIGAAGLQFMGMGYTRDDEREADRLGFIFYVRAGWAPGEFTGFFKQMIKQGHDGTPELMSDHPSLASRVEDIERQVAQLPPGAQEWRRPPVAAGAELRALQRRAKQVADTLPKDQTLQASQLMASAVPNHLLPKQDENQKRARQRLNAILERRGQKTAR